MSYWSRANPHGVVPPEKIAHSEARAGSDSLPTNDMSTIANTSAAASTAHAISVFCRVTRVVIV
jgi:hypothetical protein